jgi:hypothetical protein
MSFGKKCKEIFDKAAEAVKDAFTPPPQLQPIPVRAQKPRQQQR